MRQTQGPKKPEGIPIPIKRPRGRQAVHDYKAIWTQYLQLKADNPGYTIRQFAETRKDLSYDYIQQKFAVFNREAKIAVFHERNLEILEKSQTNIVNSLSNTELDPEFQAKHSLEAYKAVSDREGQSPQAQVISIQNTASANAASITVPLFGGQPDEFKKLVGGE